MTAREDLTAAIADMLRVHTVTSLTTDLFNPEHRAVIADEFAEDLALNGWQHRAEVLAEAAAVADAFTSRWPDMDAMKAAGIIGPFSTLGALADELRRMADAGQAGKDTRDATQAPVGESTHTADGPTEILTVRWDRTVIHPKEDPTEPTIVCCIAADTGQPVALHLDDEHREALGLMLVDPYGEMDQADDDRADPAALLALATVLEIPRPGNTSPLQLRLSDGHADRWAICDRTGRRWYPEGWMYEPTDDRLCDDGRFTLAEAVPLARQLAEGEVPRG